MNQLKKKNFRIYYPLAFLVFFLFQTIWSLTQASSFDWSKHRIEQEYLNAGRGLIKNFLYRDISAGKDKFELNIEVITKNDLINDKLKAYKADYMGKPTTRINENLPIEILNINFSLFIFSYVQESRLQELNGVFKKYFKDYPVNISVAYKTLKTQNKNKVDSFETQKELYYNSLQRLLKEYFTDAVRFDLFINQDKEKKQDAIVQLFTYRNIDTKAQENVITLINTLYPNKKIKVEFSTLLSPDEIEKAKEQVRIRESIDAAEQAKIVLRDAEKNHKRFVQFWIFIVIGVVAALFYFNYKKVDFKNTFAKAYEWFTIYADRKHLKNIQQTIEKDLRIKSVQLGAKTYMSDVVFQDSLPELIEQFHFYLKKHPTVFTRNVTTKYEDLKGIKSLQHFSPQIGSLAIEMLSVEMNLALEHINSSFDDSEIIDWLKNINARLATASISKDSFFRHIINSEVWNKLEKIPSEYLVQASLVLNSPDIFKFLLNFLPTSHSATLMESFTAENWKIVIHETSIDSAHFSSGIHKLVEISAEAMARSMPKEQFATSLIPLLDIILNHKTSKEAQEFIIKIKKIEPELGNKIESQVWTEKNIIDLPDQYLLNKINTYTFDVAVMIICGMENSTKDKILNTMGLFEKRRYNKEVLKVSRINDPATINTIQVALKAFLRDVKNDHTTDNIPYLSKVGTNVAAAA